jgi:hypothetical protein
MAKIGAVLFFVLMIVAAFGIAAFASEFFLGRPIDEVIADFLFAIFHW